MARTKNEQEYAQKKQKILNDAMRLLAEIGYEEFSVNKVITTSGLTKGAFFHYFRSKKELLDGIVKQILAPMMEGFQIIADHPTMNAKEKMMEMFTMAGNMKMQDEQRMRLMVNLLYKEENQLILYEISKEMLELNLPIFEKVITEGNNDGSLQIGNIHGTAFMLLNNVISINQELGRMMYGAKAEQAKWENLYDKMMQMESYAKEIFQFDEETNLYSGKVYEIIRQHL